MRNDLLFDNNREDLSTYMTKAAEGLRSIKNDTLTSYGINFKQDLSEKEQEEFYKYVCELAIREMEKTAGKHCVLKHKFGEESDDFLSNFKLVIMKHRCKCICRINQGEFGDRPFNR